MSNTVKSYDLSWKGDEYGQLYRDLDKLNPPIDSPNLVLHALLDGAQRWTHDLVQYTVVVDKDSTTATVISNNLVL